SVVGSLVPAMRTCIESLGTTKRLDVKEPTSALRLAVYASPETIQPAFPEREKSCKRTSPSRRRSETGTEFAEAPQLLWIAAACCGESMTVSRMAVECRMPASA